MVRGRWTTFAAVGGRRGLTPPGVAKTVVRDLQEHFQGQLRSQAMRRRRIEYSYPSLQWVPGTCQDPATPAGDGSLMVSYTWTKGFTRRWGIRWMCFPPAWVEGGRSLGVVRGSEDEGRAPRWVHKVARGRLVPGDEQGLRGVRAGGRRVPSAEVAAEAGHLAAMVSGSEAKRGVSRHRRCGLPPGTRTAAAGDGGRCGSGPARRRGAGGGGRNGADTAAEAA